MMIQTDVPLRDFTTMRLGGPARYLTAVSSRDELVQAVAWAHEHDVPLFVMGGGSNIIARDEGYPGLIILNRIGGFDMVGQSADKRGITLKIGAGENWDDVVRRTVDMGYSGIEAMSMIPGTTGATPVQNVGAYGQEIADTLQSVEVYDLVTNGFSSLLREECGFSYRNSIFKDPANRRYIIVSLTLRLDKDFLKAPLYGSLQKYCDDNGINTSQPVEPSVIREAVMAIRRIKLPDPKDIPNTGSFFKNPIVTAEAARQITATYPDAPAFPQADGSVKLAAGWLIETAGGKGYQKHGFKTSEDNALVVINESAISYDQLVRFTADIVEKVHAACGVQLTQEPETL